MSEATPSEQAVDAAPAPLAFRVTGGGEPTPEELAALVVGLTPVGAPAAEPVGPRGRALTGWQEAALMEGAGFRPFYSLADVAAYHRNLA